MESKLAELQPDKSGGTAQQLTASFERARYGLVEPSEEELSRLRAAVHDTT